MIVDKKERTGFTVWEKLAVAVIVILIIIIIILIFYQDIKDYIEIFKNWFENKV